MIRRPPRSTQSRSSAASDVYKRQTHINEQPLQYPHHMWRAESMGHRWLGIGINDIGIRPKKVGRGCCISLSAVSYTHLRAHETVLDLVCRLLLEKKKTNN
eukprot:TRINITY_DN6630_c0_g1_i1.p1 TRINITY_DN6630_c0_g1~~TRINITY_DN6630_c0_g1_i1.p1  ORF type:complete len:101 (-),score=53.36 TRINITY_DN6630_c0_g1_i1:76-378(-)